MKYYWCVNCGYRGDFGFYRAKNIKCEKCGYDSLTECEELDYKKWAVKYKHIQDKSIFYKKLGKENKNEKY